jgi:very-short-patch-repair endonuclease
MPNERARQLRKSQTDAERKLWRSLRLLKADGFHFCRQGPIDGFIVDFACLRSRIVIEVDGGQHNASAGRSADADRDAHLRRREFTVLRFWNHDVMANPDGVIEVVRRTLAARERPAPPRLASLADPPRPRGGSDNCPNSGAVASTC